VRVSITWSSRSALTGVATVAAAMSSPRWCAKDLDLARREGRGMAFRSLLVCVGDGVVERVRVVGRVDVREEAPLAQPLTKRYSASVALYYMRICRWRSGRERCGPGC
jgi:hypothetical protein